MENNKGLSMVELVVVVCILSLMTGLVAMGINFLPGKRVSACCKELKSSLQQGRINAMSSKNLVLILTREADGSYLLKESEATEVAKADNAAKVARKEIGGASLSVSYQDTSGVWHEIDVAKKLMISYDRASGALRPLIKEVKADGALIYETDPAGNYVYCTKIAVKGGQKEEHLVLVKATGKTYIE